MNNHPAIFIHRNHFVDDNTRIFTDYLGRKIRLNTERLAHLFEHPEMVGQIHRIEETLANPQIIIATPLDETVHVYHRYYEITPVTSKYLQVVVKLLQEDAFILTAFFSKRQKRGNIVWQA
jgi:hypothetical protein